MQILIFNQNWFADDLRALGHTVITCGHRADLDHKLPPYAIHIDTVLESLPNGFTPDRIVWLDDSALIKILGIEDCQIPSVFYSVDTHHHTVLHTNIAGCFDHILLAQKDFLGDFSIHSTPTTWFPLWASQTIEPSLDKKYGAVFVGTLNKKLNPQRVAFFEELQKLTDVKAVEGYFPAIFPHSEIVINQTVKGDLNFRVFEALMSGALLLTEETNNGLLDLFEDGKHLVTYLQRDHQDAADKIKSLLADIPMIRRIASAGRAEVLEKHLSWHRALVLNQILTSLCYQQRSPRRLYGIMVNNLALSAKCPNMDNALSAHAVSLCARALIEGAVPTINELSFLLRLCLKHDLQTRKNCGMTTIKMYAEAFPQLPVLQLLKIRSLLNEGKAQAAISFATSIYPTAKFEEIAKSAEEAITLLLE